MNRTSARTATIVLIVAGFARCQSLPDAPLHLATTFQLTVPASLPRTLALFGAEGERCWSHGHWDPHFIYPQPATDVQGAVFTVAHGSHKSVWVNTLYDAATGHIQYVAVLPDALAFTVDLTLTPITPNSTSAVVTYTRTALTAAANADVKAMAENDRQSGPDWQHDIEACLKTQP